MKKIKSKKSNFKNKLVDLIKEVKKNPMGVVLDFFKQIKLYVTTNVFFCLFVLFNLINGVMIRYFSIGTTETLFAFQPFMADLAVVIALGALGYLMRHKIRVVYWYFITLLCTLVCVVNSVYYTFYSSYASVSLLSIAKYGDAVSDAIWDIIKFKDISYIILPICLLFVYFRLAKKKYFVENENKHKSPKKALSSLICAGVIGALFASTLTSTDISRIAKQWNREYIVTKYGIYVYQINDVIKSIEPKISALFGYDEAFKRFTEYFKDKSDTPDVNKYTDILEGKNVLSIHLESIQDFVIGLEVNGELVAPNLTKIANGGLYFSNFYTQVSVGTSSDSEFTLATSLMPSNSGTAFVSYFNREYISLGSLLKEKGYYNVSMHGNVASYWNRNVMHKSLGYHDIIGKSEYDIDEWIGLGISDKSFFRQSVNKLKEIRSKHDKTYVTMIMLTNHTPFDIEEYTTVDFDVTMKVNEKDKYGNDVVNEYPYMEGTKLGRYLKSVHYADEALGQLMAQLEEEGILDDTVVVLYGDHDARLPKGDYQRFYNYDYKTDDLLDEDDPNYKVFESYEYELNRSTPFIIWTKDKKINGVSMDKEIKTVMGMYDVMPTLGNMLGVYNKYALGHDMFSLKENDNIVVFPTGNWVTNKVYYNAQKVETYMIGESILPDGYIEKNNLYAEELLNVSNNIIVYNLLSGVEKVEKEEINESEIVEGAG
ncbi:MAG: LTA synthase family protein [Firmicutes bacterium]|nr:LTA synthase family protein [Bacillota bacterium]